MLKKDVTLLSLLMALSVVVIGVFVVVTQVMPITAKGQGLGGAYTPGDRVVLIAGSGTATAAGEKNATTTKVYLTTGATASSTITGVLERGEQIDVSIRAIGSSTAAVLAIQPYVSKDGIDYYPVETATTTTQSAFVHVIGQTDVQYQWNVSSSTQRTCGTNEVCKHITLKGFYERYYQLRVSVVGANAAVWAEAMTKDEVPN